MKQAIVMTVVLVILCWFWLYPRPETITYIDQTAIPIDQIEVEIQGAVVFPGIYIFFESITLDQVLNRAGGFLDDADQTSLNLSQVITHDLSIRVASRNIVVEVSTFLIDVNKASFKELITIPGMTETRAASLIIYREQYGDFQHLDDLINVKNIGVVTLEKIKPYITLG